MKKLKIHASGDIGCYTLGAVAPLSVVDTTVCMGASISNLHGMEKAKGKDYIKNWVAVIGDSTFLHTGVNSLMNMVYNQATGTVIILDNSTTGMTGHQDHAATGKTLMGDTTYMINIYKLCKAMGIEHVYEVDAFDIEGLEKLIKEEPREKRFLSLSRNPSVRCLRPLYRRANVWLMLKNVRSADCVWYPDVRQCIRAQTEKRSLMKRCAMAVVCA